MPSVCYHLYKHTTIRWRHNGRDGVSNHQPHDCLLNRLFRCRSKKTSQLRVTGHLCGEFTGEFPTQMASNAENASIWWRHRESGLAFSLLDGSNGDLWDPWFRASWKFLKHWLVGVILCFTSDYVKFSVNKNDQGDLLFPLLGLPIYIFYSSHVSPRELLAITGHCPWLDPRKSK